MHPTLAYTHKSLGDPTVNASSMAWALWDKDFELMALKKFGPLIHLEK